MKISIFGCGYVGLVTGACLSEAGNHVICIDSDKNKVDLLQNGKIDIHEPDLASCIIRSLRSGTIEFNSDTKYGVNQSDIIIIAVNTPSLKDGSANLDNVIDVAKDIGKYIDREKLILNKSTAPVGTTEKIRSVINKMIKNREISINFQVASNPEFLSQGTAMANFKKPDRIIVGTIDNKVKTKIRELYNPFNRKTDKIIFMSERSAELSKYAANSMLATKISFMNEMANIADILGVDIEEVRSGICSDPRIGYSFMYPGIGFGGSCFPKDLRAIRSISEQNKYEASLIDCVYEVNERQKLVLNSKIQKFFKEKIRERAFAIWGLSFKPYTDDMREAPSREIIKNLLLHGSKIKAYDPQAHKTASAIFDEESNFSINSCKYETLRGADCLIICTEWPSFRSPDLEKVRTLLKYPIIFDGRNIFSPDIMKEHGIQYFGIGRNNNLFKDINQIEKL